MRKSKLGVRIVRGFAVLAAVTALGFALPAEAKKEKRDAKPVEDGIPDIASGEPMTLIVSLGAQKVDIYRGTTLVTTSAVSTGMAGHATKAGVFTILEKQRYHHSNIYSGAPMPWMNRITWSGTALHAGIVPGYPASHGCIRLPYSFAPKLFKITTVGEHVVVAKGRPTPEIVEHPALFQPRPLPSLPEIAKEPAPERHTYLSSGSKLAAAVTAPIVLAKAEMPNTATDAPNEAGSGSPALDEQTTIEEEENPHRIHAITPAPVTKTGHAVDEAKPTEPESHAAPASSAGITTDIPERVPAAEPLIVSPPLAEAPASEIKAEPEPAPQAAFPEAQSVAAVIEVKAEPTPEPEAVLPVPSPVAPAPEVKVEPAPQAALAPEPPVTPASLKPLTAAELTIDHGMKAAAKQAAEPRSEAPLRVLITRRTNSDRIVGVQQNLASMGYLEPQNFDGTIGRATITAIKAFQKANGMPATGSFNDELVKKVYEVAGKGEPPAGHIWVRQEFGRVFDAPVSFKNPDEPLGTYVYTALKFAPGETSTKWMAIAVQEAPTNPLDRIEISDDIRQRISERLTPGSSLIIADIAINTAGLTKGADFLVWAKDLPSSNVTAASFTAEEAKPRVKKRYRNTVRRYEPMPFQRQQLWFGRRAW
ncbi:MAG TPA: L,D-transpeptidase family protein [Methyloceanibacter sp.]|jgi:peptidoglycan hydrolase-like protein with peptidoglycan-binding domain